MPQYPQFTPPPNGYQILGGALQQGAQQISQAQKEEEARRQLELQNQERQERMRMLFQEAVERRQQAILSQQNNERDFKFRESEQARRDEQDKFTREQAGKQEDRDRQAMIDKEIIRLEKQDAAAKFEIPNEKGDALLSRIQADVRSGNIAPEKAYDIYLRLSEPGFEDKERIRSKYRPARSSSQPSSLEAEREVGLLEEEKFQIEQTLNQLYDNEPADDFGSEFHRWRSQVDQEEFRLRDVDRSIRKIRPRAGSIPKKAPAPASNDPLGLFK
jgi:hypothetical protein